jgi:Flp pilus assembly protein TadG
MSARRTYRKPRSRRGAVAVLVALCLVVLLSCVAFSLDVGGLLERQRSVQAAADAAALTGAGELFSNYTTNKGYDSMGAAVAKALAIANANGYSNDGTVSKVTARTAPATYAGGPYAGTPIPKGYVEVIVEYNQPRYFSALMGSGAIKVNARSVARGKWESAKVGIHVLDLSGRSSLTATGSGLVMLTGDASVIVNSSDPDAAAVSNGGTLIAPTFEIVGGATTSGTSGGFFGDINKGVDPQPDPLRDVPHPDISEIVTQSRGPVHLSNGTRTLQPGIYNGGITVSGQGNLQLQSGIYYMEGGGFQFGGQGNLYADGVMIFNSPKQPSDNISISGSGSGSVYLTPPKSGVYQGMTLFQRRDAENEMSVSGNGAFHVTGTFYAANARLKVAGGGDSKIGSQFISRYLDIVGNGNLIIDYHPDTAMPRRILGLVE